MQGKTLNLIGQIYDAVSEPERWNEFLENLARATGAHGARMRMLDTSHNCYSLVAGAGHDSSFDQQYQDYYSKVDIWNPVLARLPVGTVANSNILVPDKIFLKSEMYNDFWKHYEVFHSIGVNLINSDNLIARIGLHRARSLGPYEEKGDEVRLLQELAPHLVRAFKLGKHFSELHSRLDGIETALNSSTTPLLLIDEFGEVAFLNRRAKAILAEEHGISLHKNRVQLANSIQQGQLDEALSQAVATGAHRGTGYGGALRVTSSSGEHILNLLITPYPDSSVMGLGLTRRICAAVFLHETTAQPQLPVELLKGLYGLTRAEVRLAGGIVEGLSPAEAAARFGVSVNTTRTQLRSLFAKTDTQRQADLVRLLSGLTGIR